ncbi:hypothetical protein [Acinetobacter sp. ASP199]|uniref:hypothetical protein n=1 Tax=unclassified Acinetobacter TaxID=196816 RepID=UPI0031F7C14E
MANISEVRERLQNLASLMRLTTDTVETSFELTPEPLPKITGTKKAHLCDQMSIFAVHSDK